MTDRSIARAEASANLAIEGMVLTAQDKAIIEEMDRLNIPYDEQPAYIIQKLKAQ